MGLLKPTLELDDLADCDLIIEAVFENMDVKKEIFGKLDKIAKPGAILASNTSYLNIDEIAASHLAAAGRGRPALLLAGQCDEAARGGARREDRADVLVTAMQLAKKIRKVAVVAGVCHGFIGNRMLMPRQVEAIKLLLEGATPSRSTGSMSSSACRWGRSRWPTSPASTSAGTATRAGSRISATRSARRPLGPEEGRRLLRL